MSESLKAAILSEGAASENSKTGWEDLSSVENPIFNADEKAEERQYSPEEYEKLSNTERILRNAIGETMDSKVDGIRNCLGNIHEEVGRDMRFSNRQTLESLEEISMCEKSAGMMESESLVGLIDALYPSQFGNKPSMPSDPEAQEEDYFTGVRRKNSILSDEVNNLAHSFERNEALGNTDIARNASQLADNIDGSVVIARAMVDYLHEPTKDNRSRLQNAISQSTDESTEKIKRIGFGMSEVSERIGDNIIMLGRKMERSNEEYYDAIMKYIGFKLDYAPLDNNVRVEAEVEKPKEVFQRIDSEII